MTEDLHPDFAQEALTLAEPSERRELSEVLHRLSEGLPARGAPAALRARLLDETLREPERYAPFTPRLADLYDLPRERVRALLELSATPGAWKPSGLPGIKKLAVQAGAGRRGAQSYLVKFAAGVRFPEHRHDGLETAFIMAGSYTDSAGQSFATGDLHVMQPGSSHAFTIAKDEDCVAATLLEGRLNFRSLPLRLFARLLGH